jgi:hypothetical protein
LSLLACAKTAGAHAQTHSNFHWKDVITPNFVCHAQLCSHAKKAPLLRNNNPLCITTITFSNTSVTPIIIIIQSPKKAPQKKSATMQERKKETFLLSPRFARAAK